MSGENDDTNDGEWDSPSDLTRIEDLSEYDHEDDPDVEARLKAAEDAFHSQDGDLPELPSLSDLEDDLEDTLENNSDPEEDFTSSEEVSFEESTIPDLPIGEDLTQGIEDDEDSGAEDFYQASEDQEEDEGAFESFESEDNFSSYDSNLEEGEGLSDGQDFEGDFNTSENDEWTIEDSSSLNMAEELPDTQNDDQSEDQNLDFSAQNFEEEDGFTSEEEPLLSEEIDSQDNLLPEEEGNDEDFPFSSEDESLFGTDNEEVSLPNHLDLSEPATVTSAPDNRENASPITRETFQDLRDFGNAISYGAVTTGGNPPFSLILRGIKFSEDAEDIKIILNEHGLVTPENQDTISQGLENGSLLISQISEYSAIYLAHRLRKFDVSLRIGLSDQLHQSRSYTQEGRGLISKDNLKQNREESMDVVKQDFSLESIILTTTSSLQNYDIHRYIDIVSTHTLVNEDELKQLHEDSKNSDTENSPDPILETILGDFPQESVEEATRNPQNIDKYEFGLNEIYSGLVQELRNEAYKQEANAVIGINFSITPLVNPREQSITERSSKIIYKITCTGNAVLAIDRDY